MRIQSDGSLEVWLAESQRKPSQKVYVQTVIRERAVELWQKWFSFGQSMPLVFVCGNAKMPTGVREALLHVLSVGLEETDVDSLEIAYKNIISPHLFVEAW